MRERVQDRLTRRVLRIRSVSRDLDEELRFHFAETVEELMSEGASRELAEAEASRRFGDEARYRSQLETMDHEAEAMRRRRGYVDVAIQTMRLALRSVRRTPGLSAGIILALALGIGANAVMFSTIDRLLLRAPDHIRDAHSLRRLYVNRFMPAFGERRMMAFTYNDFLDINGSDAFAGIAGYWALTVPLGSGADAHPVPGWAVSSNFWRVLGVQPHIGRFFEETEDTSNGEPVVVLGHGLWRREFGADPSVLGRLVTIGTTRHTIIGVAPERFTGVELSSADIWVPFRYWFENVVRPSGGPPSVAWPFVGVVARLAPDVSSERAVEEARAIYLASHPEFSDRDSADAIVTAPLNAARVPNATSLTRAASVSKWLSGVSLLVLLIACANAANLLLARSIRQRRETAIRLALGVSRSRLIGQTLADGLVLAALASSLALALVYWGGGAMQRTFLPQVAWSGPVTARVLLLLLVTTAVAGLLSAALPAFQARRYALVDALRVSSGGTKRSVSHLRAWLVVAQAALSVVLLVGAGLFLRSFERAQAVDLGFDADRVIVLRPTVLQGSSGSDAFLFERARERLGRLSGVQAVASAADWPFGRSGSPPLRATGFDSIPVRSGSGPYIRRVSPDYLRVLGIGILQGRDFDAADVRASERVAIVSRSMARYLWPDAIALGKCLFVLREDVCTRIVGVVADAKASTIHETTTLTYYVVHEEQVARLTSLLVRAELPTDALAGALRRELMSMDSRVRDVNVETLWHGYVDPQLRSWRLGATLFSVFGVLALGIAVIGLYSVLAFDVEQRTREIGLRTALGAGRRDVVRIFIARAVKLTALGIAVGIMVALALAPRMEGLLFQTPARDPAIFSAIALLLVMVALCAAGLPAWRAAGIEANVTLREE